MVGHSKYLLLIVLFFLPIAAFGQESCVSADDVARIKISIKKAATADKDFSLGQKLLKMKITRELLVARIAADPEKTKNLIPKAEEMGLDNFREVCSILRKRGWISRAILGDTGFEAFTYHLTNTRNLNGMRELLPVLVEAFEQAEIGGNIVAAIIDQIRVAGGVPQIFGTQAVIRNGIVYIQPLLNPEKVNDYRKAYDLPPLRDQIITMERRYLLPVVRAPRLWVPPELRNSAANKSVAPIPGIVEAEDAPLTVETRLVNLNVRVFTKDLKTPAGVGFTKEDFQILENDRPQEISFFSSTAKPFDLVLLLDYSGSTLPRRKLIADAAKRFIDVVRPDDRIAIVAFGSTIITVSEFTADKKFLRESIDKIELNGDSPIWDSINYVFKNLLSKRDGERRSAMVFMTDAEDNSRTDTFADAMEIVRNHDTTIFPVYVGRTAGFSQWADRFLQKSRDSLWMLAEETGGQLYLAREMKDLAKVYEQIAGELGRVYSISYEPSESERDGGWRSVRVVLKNRPEMVIRARRGYYAK